MRIKLFVLAVVAGLATTLPTQAGAVLGFGMGPNQSTAVDPNTPAGDPGNPNGGSSTDPHTLAGLNDWTLGSRLGDTNTSGVGNSAGNPLVINGATTSQLIIQIQLRDSATLTFPNTNTNTRMFQWGVRLSWTLGGPVTSTPDNDPNNGQAYQQTVNDSTNAPNENINYANQTQSANSYGLGNIFFTPWNSTNTTYQDNGTLSTAGSAPRNYILANVILNIANLTGDSVLTMTDMDGSVTNWSNGASTSLDSTVFATIPQLFIHVNGVPEPSSMALIGIGLGGLVYRKIRSRKSKAAV